MARNEEKQQGRLNRLWLQKEREEGRLKDVQERRPKLCTLNTTSSVKKWIPSIKTDMEYYLQQSQLTHYPERKIAEFQLKLEALEREYKSFVTKLRVLDPTCKHKPWTPRAYCKRRADVQGSTSIVKKSKASTVGLIHSESSLPAAIPTTEVTSDQDQPLAFDRMRLAMAAAAFRGVPDHQSVSETQNLARILQRSLPNLGNAAADSSSVAVQKDAASESAGKSSMEHVLGLDCYYSSEDETDT
ncbi:uncharacterized protein si:dkey-86e18.1 [Corythoichthys intestinalis]|uniref:uncharacterized protein si:dkey-86e18.1 n=1 Tax=Corythoichthys intestinalis TaxID=161448 RepID=UPI0025A672B4|nr:uncharacterized protein si:dkey-86e18.1 [Corythoichthys intestinalis]